MNFGHICYNSDFKCYRFIISSKGKLMYFLGVDGGGTKTAAVLVRLGACRTTTSAVASAGNVATIGREATEALLQTILVQLGVADRTDEIGCATFAFAGAGRPKERQMVESIVRSAGIQNSVAMTDAEILHYSVFEDKQGVLLLAGTGSVCVFRNATGEYQQIGGWSYLLGDEGSGFDIGRQAIRAALRGAELGRPPSQLTYCLLSFYELACPEDLVTAVSRCDNQQQYVASCAAVVAKLAEQGDLEASSIIDAAVEALVGLATTAKELTRQSGTIDVAVCGGALQPSTLLTKRFGERTQELGLSPGLLFPELHPAAACVLYAMKTNGQPLDDELMNDLKQVRFQTARATP